VSDIRLRFRVCIINMPRTADVDDCNAAQAMSKHADRVCPDQFARDETAAMRWCARRASISALKAEEERACHHHRTLGGGKDRCGGGLSLRAKLREGGVAVEDAAKTPPAKPAERRRAEVVDRELRAKNAELATLQGESPLILPSWTPRLWPAWWAIGPHPRGAHVSIELETS
jgi:hypothetical protein